MSSERWGGFSVKDHIDAAALAADVLLYERLLLPVPSDDAEEERWKGKDWKPELQKQRLEALGDLAERIPWNEDRRKMYDAEIDKLRGQGLQVNGYQLTGMMLARERGVDVVAAYHSADAFQVDYPKADDLGRQAYLSYLLGARFAVPKGDPEDALEKAVKLAKLPEFQEQRLAMYDWQREMIEKQIPALDAVERMGQLLKKYNACVEKATKDVYYKFAYTVAGVALSIAAAPASPIAAGGALLTMVQFAKETKPPVTAARYAPAAMFHEFENIQKPFWDWTKHS
jgi:hypothetical protein